MRKGQQFKRIRDALVDAFKLDELDELVRFNFDVDLETVVAVNKPRNTVVLDLIEWADARHQLGTLLAAAHRERPANQELAQLAQEIAAIAPAGTAPGQMQRVDVYDRLRGVAQPKPDVEMMLIPWLCDRLHQTDAVKDVIRRARALDAPRPVICLLHGNQDECHDKFVERIVDYELAKLQPSLGAAQHKVLELPPQKNGSAADLHGFLCARLSDKFVGGAAATPTEINSYFANLRAPVVIHSLLGIGGWGRDERSTVHDYLAFWNQWPDKPAAQLLLIFLCIRVQPPLWSRLTSFLGRQDSELDAALAEFSTLDGAGRHASWDRIICRPLPALKPISRDQAAEWASDPEVQQWFGGRDLVSEIDQVYNAQRTDALPMATLHRLLVAALKLPAAAHAEFAREDHAP